MTLFRNHGSTVEEILDQVRGYWTSSIIITAIELDIFSAIGDQELTANDLALSLNLNKDGLERMLNALASLKLLQKYDDFYSNTFTSFTHLNQANEQYIGHIILYHRTRYDVWGRLSESIKSGKPIASASYLTPNQEIIDNYARAMHARAKLEAPDVLLHVDLQDCSNLLDLGGAPGTFAVEFARKYPELQITIVDLPDMIPITKELVQKYGYSDQIHCIGGNFEVDDIGSDYDAVFMSQILSSLGESDVTALFKKIFSSLKPHGKLINRDLILRANNTEPADGVFRSLNSLLTTEQGRTYSVEDLQRILYKTGFKNLQFLQLMGSTDLVVAYKF